MRIDLKRLAFTTGTALLIVVIGACNFGTLPEEIRVKASPTYEVPAGTSTILLEDHFPDLDADLTDALLEFVGDDGVASVSVVDDAYTIDLSYRPIQLNTADFFSEEVDLVGTVDQTIDPISFTVPSVDLPPTEISEDIQPISLPDSVVIPPVGPFEVFEATTGSVTFADGGDSAAIGIPTEGFDSITFDRGSLQTNLEF